MNLVSSILVLFGIPIIFSAIRFLLGWAVAKHFRQKIMKTGFCAVVSMGFLSFIAFISAAFIVYKIFGVNIFYSDILLNLSWLLTIIPLYVRLVLSATPLGIDQKIYESEWMPDPKQSDRWNISRRLKIDRLMKMGSFFGAIVGAAIVMNFWNISEIESQWLKYLCIYVICGWFTSGVHFGLGHYGSFGVLPTVLFCLIAWPFIMVFDLYTLYFDDLI
jgi:hypothetical protein